MGAQSRVSQFEMQRGNLRGWSAPGGELTRGLSSEYAWYPFNPRFAPESPAQELGLVDAAAQLTGAVQGAWRPAPKPRKRKQYHLSVS